jgi:hypothetical protein
MADRVLASLEPGAAYISGHFLIHSTDDYTSVFGPVRENSKVTQ